MIAPLTAFSAVYTARARPSAAAPPVRPPSSGAVAEAVAGTAAGQPEKTPAPPLTGAVNTLSKAAMLIAVQESLKAVKSPLDLTDEERKIVTELKKRDQEVRRHERAHTAAAGPYGGLPVYDLQQGPDGRLYAVGGEVAIDVKPLKDPAATIAKAESVIRAALAPANPSAQDHSVAAQARQLKAEAVVELNKEKEAEKADKENNLSNIFPQAAADAYGKVGTAAPAIAVIDIVNAPQGVSLSV